jgi:hypothetical protein
MQITSVTDAIHEDFFSISGSNFPDNVVLVFENQGNHVSIIPDFVRPHLIFLEELPTTISTGNYSITVSDGTSSSNSVSIYVSSEPKPNVRIIHPGASKHNPYTIAFIANPAIRKEDGTFISDPVLQNRGRFQSIVIHCFQNLFNVTEDLLCVGNIDEQMRSVLIFDDSVIVSDDNALAAEYTPNMMETRRKKLAPFLAKYQITADMVFVIHGSLTHNRATAWYTSDDSARGGTHHYYDGIQRIHGHYPKIPGSATIPLSVNPSGLTVIHEFFHAASDFNNGRVNDLYYDGQYVSTAINKKWRASATDPVPADFSTYNTTTYSSKHSGYPLNWKSYHSQSIDISRPNLMDNYWNADDPHLCRLDHLTYTWFRDRLEAKLSR